MDYFETSIQCLEEAAPALARQIRAAREEAQACYRIETARSGDSTMIFTDPNGRERLMHSKHDPRTEAARIVKSTVDQDTDCVVIGGFGLAWHIEAILKRAPKASLVIVEDHAAALAAACEARDLSGILTSGRVDLALGTHTEDLMTLLEGKTTRKVSLFLHRASADRNPDFYHNLKNLLYSWLNGKEVNIATLVRFERLWTRNLLRNLPVFARSPGVEALFGTMQNVPVFVVAAGPSLAKNIHLLSEVRTKGIIIAVDTIYKVLLAHQIIPHIVVAVDPQLINAHFFAGANSPDTILVADSAVSPTLLANHDGPVALSAVPFPFASWFESLFGTKGALSSGGSVATTAFDLAVQMGGNPVVLIGQDLAYSNDRIHMRGTNGEQRWENTCTRVTPVTRNMRAFLRNNCTVRVPAWDKEGEVWSDRKFLTFLWWFERQVRQIAGRIRVINATEGGAHISGAEHLSLQSVLAELPVSKTLPLLPSKTTNTSFMTCLNQAQEFEEFLTTLIEKSSSAQIICQKVLSNTLPVQESLPILDTTDSWIHNHPLWSRLISSSMQRVIHTVKEGFALREDSTTDGVAAAFGESAALYQGINEAATKMRTQVRSLLLDRLAEPSA